MRFRLWNVQVAVVLENVNGAVLVAVVKIKVKRVKCVLALESVMNQQPQAIDVMVLGK